MPTGSSPRLVAAATDGGQSHRILEIDGLRGCAIALVLFFHYFELTARSRPATLVSYLLVPGRLTWSGVDLFFVLSGFLIGGILLDARAAANYFRVFYTRRFFRIVPIYFVLLATFAAVRVLIGSAAQGSFAWLFDETMPLWTFPFFLQNFWMAAAGSFGCNWLAATWSLAVEEQFYLTLPSIVRFFSRHVLVACVILGIVAAPVFRIILFRPTLTGWLASYVLLFCRADALLFGVASLGLTLAALALTLGLAHLSWNFFEARLVKFSHRARYEFLPTEESLLPAAAPAGARQ